jgi:phosphomannomutase
MDLVMALADEKQCAVAIANDPDADRLCAAARDSTGKLRQLTGDELGTLLGDAMLRQLSADSAASPPWVLSTIVSSRLLARLAGAYGARHRETLTGFKWLGPAASALTSKGERFAFAYEEALGYMACSLVWDKDGLSALLALADLACALDAEGKTLLGRLEEIQRRVGVAITTQRTIRLQPGTSGSSIMKRVRAQKPDRIGDFELALVEDLLDGRPPADTPEGEIPKNDVLRYFFATADISKESARKEIMLGAPRIQVRPSGTEPKVRACGSSPGAPRLTRPLQVKIYCEALGEVRAGESFEAAQQRIRAELDAIVDVVYAWLVADA